MFSALLQHHRELQFIIQLFGKMLGVDDLLIRSDNRIHILEKHDPWQYWVRKSRLLRFLMMLAKISRRMEEFLRDNRSLDANRFSAEENRLSIRPLRFRAFLQGIFERDARRVETAIPILKKPPHIRWQPCLRQ